MIISDGTESIACHKTTDSTRDIGNYKSQYSTSCAPRDLIHPAMVGRDTRCLGIIPECFFEYICELSIGIGSSVICAGGRTMVSSGCIVFFALKSLADSFRVEVLF